MVFTSRNLDWWCKNGILLLVLAILVFAPLAFGAVYGVTFLVVQVLVMGVGVLWLARLWGGHKPKLLWPPLAWAVVAFVLYAVARYFTADIEYEARQELIRILVYAFLFLAVVSNVYDQEATEMVTFTLTAVAALDASYALTQFLHHTNQVWNLTSPYSLRASGTYINPDHFAGFLEMILPLALAFLMAGRVGVITRVLLVYATLAIMGGLAVTFSRGAWLAATAGMLMLFAFLLCHRNHRLRALLVLVVLMAVGGYFAAHFLANSAGFKQRLARVDANGPAALDTGERFQMWQAGLDMWHEHPWLGVGPGLFDYRFREYRPESFQRDPVHAHNDYIELLADWGATGAAIVLGGIGIFIFGLAKTWPHVRREENDFGFGMSSRYAFFLGAISGLFALAVHSLVDFNLHIPANVLIGVTLLGLVATNLRFATKRHWWRARWPLQSACTVALGGAVIYLGAQGWRRGGEIFWTTRAAKQPIYSAENAAALQKALAWEPKNHETAYKIGECFRIQSQDGGDDYATLAQTALTFYAQGIRVNPHDAYCQLGSGMCLDWLGRHAEAEKHYSEAEMHDPNGNFVVANIGWHYVQTGDFAAARQWYLRANKLDAQNQIAINYLFHICEPKLEQKASGQLPMSLFYSGKDN